MGDADRGCAVPQRGCRGEETAAARDAQGGRAERPWAVDEFSFSGKFLKSALFGLGCFGFVFILILKVGTMFGEYMSRGFHAAPMAEQSPGTGGEITFLRVLTLLKWT